MAFVISPPRTDVWGYYGEKQNAAFEFQSGPTTSTDHRRSVPLAGGCFLNIFLKIKQTHPAVLNSLKLLSHKYFSFMAADEGKNIQKAAK